MSSDHCLLLTQHAIKECHCDEAILAKAIGFESPAQMRIKYNNYSWFWNHRPCPLQGNKWIPDFECQNTECPHLMTYENWRKFLDKQGIKNCTIWW